MTGREINGIKMSKTNYCHFENYRDKIEFKKKNMFHGSYIKKVFYKYMRIIYYLNNIRVKLIASN